MREARFLRSAVDIPAPGDAGAKGGGVLRIETRQMLSPDSAVLEIRSVLNFFRAESRVPSARVETIYRSKPVGDLADEAAVARWAYQRGWLYRRALAEAMFESLKLARMAMQSLVEGDPAGPEVELWVSLTWGQPGFGRKLNAKKLVGILVEETPARLLLRSGGAFYSLPASAIESREVVVDRRDLP